MGISLGLGKLLRVIKIQNLSGEDITLGSGTDARVVPALGSLTLTHSEYIQKAIDYDLSSYNIRILMPNIQLKKVSIKDFGAIGDGMTDDTDAIQNAIDYVAFYGGGVVEVPIGVYIISGIIISGNISLQGESKRDSVLKLKGDSQNAVISFSGTSAEMNRLRIVGRGA